MIHHSDHTDPLINTCMHLYYSAKHFDHAMKWTLMVFILFDCSVIARFWKICLYHKF